jgi:hypothetical protein
MRAQLSFMQKEEKAGTEKPARDARNEKPSVSVGEANSQPGLVGASMGQQLGEELFRRCGVCKEDLLRGVGHSRKLGRCSRHVNKSLMMTIDRSVVEGCAAVIRAIIKR